MKKRKEKHGGKKNRIQYFNIVSIYRNLSCISQPFSSDCWPKIGVAAYLRAHLFWELVNAWLGIVRLALVVVSIY